MKLSPTELHELLRERFPRHVNDVLVAKLADAQTADPVVLIVDTSLWDFDITHDKVLMSMDLTMARELHNRLAEVIDALDAGI